MKLTKKHNIKTTITFHPVSCTLPEKNRSVLCIRDGNSTMTEGFYRNIDGCDVLEPFDNIPNIRMEHFCYWAYTDDITTHTLNKVFMHGLGR